MARIGLKTLIYAIMAVHAAASTGGRSCIDYYDSLSDLQMQLLDYSNAAIELKQEYLGSMGKIPIRSHTSN